MTVPEAHAHTREGVQAVRNHIAPRTLALGASLTLQDRLAKWALDNTYPGGSRIADLLDSMGAPQVP